MKEENENILHLGADLDKDFVLAFRDYCRSNDFKQKTLIQRLVELWLALDPINQEHIYRGRLNQIIGAIQAHSVVQGAKAETAKQKQKRVRKPLKAG